MSLPKIKKVASFTTVSVASAATVAMMSYTSSSLAQSHDGVIAKTQEANNQSSNKRFNLSRNAKDNLIYATATEPLSLDPGFAEDTDSANLICNMYEGLVKFGESTNDILPSLATSWEQSEDGMSYIFHLRQGVKFHDGTDFNAQAVKINIDRQIPPNRLPNMTFAPMVYEGVKSCDVIDEYTVRVNMSYPNAALLRNLTMYMAAPIVSPTALEKYNNNVSEHPCGTGPYRFALWEKGEQIVITSNDDYWGAKPHIKNVVYKVIKEPASRAVALNNGEVDVINGIDANVIDLIERGDNVISYAEGVNTSYMLFNCNEGYTTRNLAIRQALSMAVNVPELVKTLYRGYATAATSFFPPIVPGFEDKVYNPYNPQLARKILSEHGIKHLKIITYANARMYNNVGGQVLAEAVQAYLKAVGVDTTIESYDWGLFKSKLKKDPWDIAFIGRIGISEDPDNFISMFATSDVVANNSMWHNDEYTRILTELLPVEDDEATRIKLYKKAVRILLSDAAVLPLSHARILIASRSNVKNAAIHPAGVSFFSLFEKEEE